MLGQIKYISTINSTCFLFTCLNAATRKVKPASAGCAVFLWVVSDEDETWPAEDEHRELGTGRALNQKKRMHAFNVMPLGGRDDHLPVQPLQYDLNYL